MQTHEALSTHAPIAVALENAPQIVGVSRTRIFEAIRNGELSARKAGRSTIIEIDELKRWVKSLPIKRHELTEMVA
jgi:excisionase family DNA binding protein